MPKPKLFMAKLQTIAESLFGSCLDDPEVWGYQFPAVPLLRILSNVGANCYPASCLRFQPQESIIT
jgi:hypothetical protein